MWGRICISSSSSNLLLLVLAAMAACLHHPAAISSHIAPAPAAANLIHHEGGGGESARNPANSLVALVNANRTAARLPPLRNSKGLGCMALQYISHCAATCDTGAPVACHPPETDVTEVYAANCGVELPTVDLITGRLLGCSHDFDDAAFVLGTTAAAVIRGKEHTQVGAGILRQRRHGPYFWGLLFSSGSPGSTFRLEAAGRGIAQTHGCFSDPDDALSCNSGNRRLISCSMAVPSALLLLLILFLLS